MSPTLRILLIIVPGFFVGVLVIDNVRRIFSDDDGLTKRLFTEQPATSIAAATTIGSVLVYAVSRIIAAF